MSTGSMVDLAIAFFLSRAMNAVVGSIVSDLFSPLISITCDAIGLSNGRIVNFFIILKHGSKGSDESYNTLQEAHDDDAVTINHGKFILVIIDFFSTSFICFILASVYLKIQKDKKKGICNECLEPVKQRAIRCPHCTCILAAPGNMEQKSIQIRKTQARK